MENSSDFILFIGRFHPLVVHFPIGFLFFAFILELFSRWKKNHAITEAIPLALLLGFISALLSCILGYMLSTSDEYDTSILDTHFWFGIATTVVTLMAWLIRIKKIKFPSLHKLQPNISALTLLVVLVSITGHYGGNLTHGIDYLTKYAPFAKDKVNELAAVTNVDDAVIFGHLVSPILDKKCASCHNAEKQKGRLSFQDSTTILKGGKNGPVLIAGNSLKSEMIKRVMLAPAHDDFMPPEGKTPLTDEEKKILTYWIDNADANFSAKVSDIETSDEMAASLSVFLGFDVDKNSIEKGDVVSESILNEITSEGFKLRELVFRSNLYSVILPSKMIKEANANALEGKLLKLLKMNKNIVDVSIQNNFLKDEHLKIINQLESLQQLKIDRNPITDLGLKAIIDHPKIMSLNVYQTKITKESLKTFSKMKNLKKVYVWGTSIKKDDLIPYNDQDDFPEVVTGF